MTKKYNKLALLCSTAFALSAGILSAEEHNHPGGCGHDHGTVKKEAHAHDHAEVAGPNHGRILHDVSPHAELFVTADRLVKITFIDDEGKAIAPAEQSISAVCGNRSAPTKLTFAKTGDSFTSEQPLPAGTNVATVLQVKMSPDAQTKNIRINLNLADCPTCDFQEYACNCEH
ncbi:hypothetical protein [Persicirhabdus sediminis]|uniref:Uncharacterized protein n=1 Tax=Persicirhabdus sediminis TaxID=454144 RepID=A0A8J7SKC0_9BACT|nr:hypothetical protein [Persicirhabdus sediminis]MBK1792735.1 hypothetical protein [Persicirhabdus sediminis]